MSEHPSDTSENRFRAAVAGTVAFFSFGLLTWLVMWISGADSSLEESLMGQFSAEEKQQYAENYAAVTTAQKELVDDLKLKAAMKSIASDAPEGSASAIVVPNSETFLKQAADAAAAAAPIEEDAQPKPEGEGEAKKEKAKAKGKGKGNAKGGEKGPGNRKQKKEDAKAPKE